MKVKFLAAIVVLALTGGPDAFADQVFYYNGVPWNLPAHDPNPGFLGTQLTGTATVACASSICADGTYTFASGSLSVALTAGAITLVTSPATVEGSPFVTILGGNIAQ
jgi:hypothetical protein